MLAKKGKEKEIKSTETFKNFILKFASSQSLVVADNIVKEGNDKLKNCLLQKTITRKELQRAHSKIQTGMKRRQQLSEEQQFITKRIKELEHISDGDTLICFLFFIYEKL